MPDRRMLSLGRLSIHVGSLKGNHHGPDGSTLRSTRQRFKLGNYPMSRYVGWRWYRYRVDGSSRFLDVIWDRRTAAERRGAAA